MRNEKRVLAGLLGALLFSMAALFGSETEISLKQVKPAEDLAATVWEILRAGEIQN